MLCLTRCWETRILQRKVLPDIAADRSRETGTALESHYRFLLWLIPAVERFPRAQKFLLGDRIQCTAVDVLEVLIEATYTKRRGNPLERPRHLMRPMSEKPATQRRIRNAKRLGSVIESGRE